MKKILFLPIVALLAGCGSGVGIKQVDKRAATELATLKEFAIADSIYQSQINDVTKKESFDKSTNKLTDYVENTLKKKVENWEATIKYLTPGIDGIDATFIIYKNADFEGHTDITEPTITLESENINDNNLQKILKTLQPEDVVLISGAITSERDGGGVLNFQTINHVTIDDEDQLRYPSFTFKLTDVRKKPQEKL